MSLLDPGPDGPRAAGRFQWHRRHPLAFDAALAVAAFACVLCGAVVDPHRVHGPKFAPEHLTATTVVLAALACTALVFRRRLPRTVLAVTGALTIVELVARASEVRAPVAAAAVIALYSLAARTDRPTTWRIGALTVVVLTASAMLYGPRPWYAQQNIAIFAWTGMAAAAGDAVRSRRAYVDAIRERAERAERTREEEARRRVAEERMRIARDLHDVVAHHIALVNVQAGVASHVMDSRPDQAKEALAHVREASRSALDELSATVGLLRQSDDPTAPTEPAPGLGLLDQLTDGFVRAGLPVDLDVPDELGQLPASVDLTAYRVVQEALTNVHKHAGEGARATVRIVRAETVLTVTVLDDGAGRAGVPRQKDGGRPAGRGGGHGLIGMRERVSALRGTIATGPRAAGGFQVRVTLPLQPARTGEPS
ncbi:putative two-component histidine kinase [Streptomyces sp. NBRC 110611]|uniref:sensor histidine kinase n=1 Tax=Streptomyces sp. NBRC 110611 TaxID=1621259 RepID=UPI0008331673|nr:histidine kinase [Streptomyces sp. NBRC 110611]GAU69518.1 putative two-component histidine kinase [Streptomyces sp. NBRC 110611]